MQSNPSHFLHTCLQSTLTQMRLGSGENTQNTSRKSSVVMSQTRNPPYYLVAKWWYSIVEKLLQNVPQAAGCAGLYSTNPCSQMFLNSAELRLKKHSVPVTKNKCECHSATYILAVLLVIWATSSENHIWGRPSAFNDSWVLNPSQQPQCRFSSEHVQYRQQPQTSGNTIWFNSLLQT